MAFLLHETLIDTANRTPHATLLQHGADEDVSAVDLLRRASALAEELKLHGVVPGVRVGIFLPKVVMNAVSYYAISMVGAVFVPINPILKRAQVRHILDDCSIQVLITSAKRLEHIEDAVDESKALRTVFIVDNACEHSLEKVRPFDPSSERSPPESYAHRIDSDLAGILYTSGSTGLPKGVMLSHRNVIAAAASASQYLEITHQDKILAVLPLSFDYGLNQLFSSVLCGASCVLFDYLMPRDVLKAIVKFEITGIAAVPAIWTQLAPLDWPVEASETVRYLTNSGGTMPLPILQKLRERLPRTKIFLQYGLTEAFRSTYLPPEDLDRKPGSVGIPIPNADICVVNDQGQLAGAGEHGELVQRGGLVTLGYWNDPERTAIRFKPAPERKSGFPMQELAVWSGDKVYLDEEGYLYFVGRDDGMIKTSGYRVSPEEIEGVIYDLDLPIELAAAVGAPNETIGQEIVLVIKTRKNVEIDFAEITRRCADSLPAFMLPRSILRWDEIPLNQNGKIDRRVILNSILAANPVAG